MPPFQLMLPILAALLLLAFPNRLTAQLTILHNFGDGSVTNDGAYPSAGLIQAPNGNFFGVTEQQANHVKTFAGTVFEMTLGGTVSVIYRFGIKSHIYSNQPLLYYQGKLLGVTVSTSSTETGALFALRKAHSTGLWGLSYWQKNLGAYGSPILGSDGNLYGVGAVGSGIGGVYGINPTTHQIVTTYSFNYSNFGLGPGLVEGNDKNFYGSTNGLQGFQYHSGAIFQLTPSGQVTFTQFIPLQAAGPMIQVSNGTFYGIGAAFGGIEVNSSGFVYSYLPNGSGTYLHNFGQGSDGANPVGTVVLGPNGNLYGVTTTGGTANSGIIFQLSLTDGSYTIMHNFGDGSVPNDGLYPLGSLIVGQDNNLYGTTSGGGTAGLGTIFKISP